MPHQLLFPKIHISRIAGSPISYLPSPISCEAQPDPDLLDSLVLQRPPASPAGSDLNFNLNLNERAEPYALLVNCFLFFSHLFPYVLVVALAVWRS